MYQKYNLFRFFSTNIKHKKCQIISYVLSDLNFFLNFVWILWLLFRYFYLRFPSECKHIFEKLKTRKVFFQFLSIIINHCSSFYLQCANNAIQSFPRCSAYHIYLQRFLITLINTYEVRKSLIAARWKITQCVPLIRGLHSEKSTWEIHWSQWSCS